MFEALKIKVAKMIANKYILPLAVKGYSKLEGYKTVLSIVGIVVVWVLTLFGLDQTTAATAYTFFGGTGLVSFFEKLKKIEPALRDFIADVLAEAQKQKSEPAPAPETEQPKQQ